MGVLPKLGNLSRQNPIDFINTEEIEALLAKPSDPVQVREIIAKSLNKEALTLAETAILLNADDPKLIEEIFEAARTLKKEVYGNRIVLFAPFYVGNHCMNDCRYCAFRRSNNEQIRRTLSDAELEQGIRAILKEGHKRTILVYGEHPMYDAQFIADSVRKVYAIKEGNSTIRRININAAPMDHEGYRIIKEAGIGTYQIFQETYHKPTYAKMHPENTRKGDFLWRLDSLSRALEAGADDVGIGALFGLYNWKFEVMGLVAHAIHLMKTYGVGPHTISFPRIRPASGVDIKEVAEHDVPDADFLRVIAILRLSVPYTGLILTAREPAALRREALGFGVSQIDAGSRVEIGGYVDVGDKQVLEREQFELGDVRPLDEVIGQLLTDGFIPSFCTACYRLGRTGQVFMEYAIPGFIQNMCTPNAMTTLQEYLVDYASPETKAKGEVQIAKEMSKLSPERQVQVEERLQKIRNTQQRDLYF